MDAYEYYNHDNLSQQQMLEDTRRDAIYWRTEYNALLDIMQKQQATQKHAWAEWICGSIVMLMFLAWATYTIYLMSSIHG